MDTKLTLKLDKYVIDKAKDYAQTHKRSLSRIIESYLKSLINDDDSDDKEEIKISAFVKDLATGVNIPAEIDYKKLYSDYLSDKYK
jgi:hypothetical protein